jgi:hypothetical protein
MDAPVPAEPLPWAPMEDDALRRVRKFGDRQMTQTE